MRIKKHRLFKISCFAVIVSVIVGFMLNWYMTNRVERFLREVLSERVSLETGGFYRFHSDHLDIGFFNGELTLKGVEIKVDSTVFRQWAAKDSLPATYVDIKIEKIHFKGLNLVWQTDDRRLNFDLFEIQKPIVKIFETTNSSHADTKSKNIASASLYEMISPYIDVLSVRKMNLNNAGIVYETYDLGVTSVYSLNDVSFQAYGFLLDKNSEKSGKLLFCDNFDFTTNQPQVLLSNNQFLLQTDNIRLSTKDSIIRIDEVHLKPLAHLWENRETLSDDYIESKIKSVEVNGIHFKRESSFNYLRAKSFNIDNSETEYFNVEVDNVKKQSDKQAEVKDTLNLPWTLYAIVSPLLRSISIDKIDINEARLKYTNASKNGMDVYNLAHFNFEAYGFKIDSLADIQKRFLYSQDFLLDAADIEGALVSQNQAMSIERLRLNTLARDFQINKVKLSPISFNNRRNSIVGTIDSIRLSGWEYDKGMKAQQLSIDAPRIEYVRTHKSTKEKISAEGNQSVNLNVVVPFFNYLSINEIKLNNGNITYRDRTNKDNVVYKLPKVDLFVSKFLIDETTIKNSDTYFACDNLRLSFERFDNLLPGNEYRLMIKKGVFTGIRGNIELRDVKLLPQKETWKKIPDTYVSLETPFVAVRNVDYQGSEKENRFVFKNFKIESPTIQVVKVRASTDANKAIIENKGKATHFIAGLFDVSNARIEYSDQTTEEDFKTTVNKLQFKSLFWNNKAQKASFGEIVIQSPVIDYRKYAESNNQDKKNSSKPFTGSLNVGKIQVSDIKVNIERPAMKLYLTTPDLNILGVKLQNRKFNLASVDITKPTIEIDQMPKSEQPSKTAADKPDIYKFFAKLGKEVSVGRFNISNASLDYAGALNGGVNRQQRLNATNLILRGLVVNSELKTLALDDINFSTRNFRIPINNGLYTLQAESIDLRKKESDLKISALHLIPAYAKNEFAYHHPTHKDWFDVGVESISLSEIDFNKYFTDNTLHAKELLVNDVELLNYKNQQIEIEHDVMPMIYEGMQKLPVGFSVDTANVNNVKVVYEEMPKNGTTPGVIFFTGMNGRLSGLTNIVSRPQQYIHLDADGYLMGTGRFSATWMLPVDSLNDHFYLKAHLAKFDLRDLNQLITPMAPVRVETGFLKSLTFTTNASSKGATVDMLMLYNDLGISVLKNKDGELTTKSFASTLANKIIKTNNPDKPSKRPRHVHLTVERNAYHSTFNYLWQILQPATVESLGFSQKKQTFAKDVSDFFKEMKNIFRKKKKRNQAPGTLHNLP